MLSALSAVIRSEVRSDYKRCAFYCRASGGLFRRWNALTVKASPLGKYAAAVAAIVVLLVICAALYSHTFGEPDTLIDAMALIAFGLITGTAGSLTLLNGTVKRTDEQDVELISLRREVNDLRQSRS